jgi:hypothetical protein
LNDDSAALRLCPTPESKSSDGKSFCVPVTARWTHVIVRMASVSTYPCLPPSHSKQSIGVRVIRRGLGLVRSSGVRLSPARECSQSFLAARAKHKLISLCSACADFHPLRTVLRCRAKSSLVGDLTAPPGISRQIIDLKKSFQNWAWAV